MKQNESDDITLKDIVAKQKKIQDTLGLLIDRVADGPELTDETDGE